MRSAFFENKNTFHIRKYVEWISRKDTSNITHTFRDIFFIITIPILFFNPNPYQKVKSFFLTLFGNVFGLKYEFHFFFYLFMQLFFFYIPKFKLHLLVQKRFIFHFIFFSHNIFF